MCICEHSYKVLVIKELIINMQIKNDKSEMSGNLIATK